MKTTTLIASVLFLVLGAAGCHLDGEVIVNSHSGDMGTAPVDLSVKTVDMGAGCGLNTCAMMNANCGIIGDGCSGTLDCGKCTGHETCGGGGVPFQCGGMAGCVPLTCMQLGLGCGPAGDGCGGMLNCDPPGGCPSGQTCGGGGKNGQCGTKTTQTLPDAGTLCMPKTCGTANCGQIGDGCGNLLTCGAMGGGCPSGQTCGGGGVPFQCGAPPCVPKTCAQLGVSCGPAGDGCGGLAKDSMGNPNCGTCTTGTCGGGGKAGQCGLPVCVPKTCAQLGDNCGTAGDGCGGVAKDSMGNPGCGTCATGTCGGGGTPNKCGGPVCTPKTCAQLGYNCGTAGDGCGGLIPGGCGTCTGGAVCGLSKPNQCGSNISGAGQCDGGVTTISGTVVAPTDPSLGFGNPDPIDNALVYVPSTPITALPVGVPGCDQCSASTPALVQAVTGIDGKFTLTNPPTGPGVKVVIQLGRWRRVLTLNVVPCVDNPLTTAQTHLPRIQGGNTGALDPMDNIPRFAISTGAVDALECVLRKMGIADSEFQNPAISGGLPTATGRVHVYQARSDANNGTAGARINKNTPDYASLWGNQTTIDAYDAVLFPCTGGEDDKTTAAQDVVTTYGDSGGRVFATHFSYVWTFNTYNNTTAKVPWGCGPGCSTTGQTTAVWDPDTQYSGTFTGFIDQSFPKGVSLAQWLNQPAVGASTTLGQIPVNVVRWDFDSVVAGQQWMYSTNPPNTGPASFPLHYTFNTPVLNPPATQCGRVVYSDFHVENVSNDQNVTFPTECGANAPLTPQEKLLEFMLFDLTSCVQPDVPTCTPKTCAQLGFNCGMQGDGCGGTINCGACTGGQVCGGGGMPGVCSGGCTTKSCTQLGFNCGTQTDGCGGTQNCGTCTVAGQTCGGGGTPGVCGGGACTPLTCAQQGINCGPAGDGCGGLAQPNPCGTCAPPQTCGGGGTPGQCGGGCTPLTCTQLGLSCGPAGDGCGGTLDCGTCTMPGQTCGGGGAPGICGAPPDGGAACQPLTCAQQGLSCGSAGDGCGNLLNCGSCPPPQTCGGGGVPGKCGAPNCTPTTCAKVNATCGIIGDGCGGTINCGTCTPPQTCGGAGVAFQCGIIG